MEVVGVFEHALHDLFDGARGGVEEVACVWVVALFEGYGRHGAVGRHDADFVECA